EMFPMRIEMVSRFRSRPEIKKTLLETAEGKVVILIGTHRLLSKDVQFQDLGLLLIDDQQPKILELNVFGKEPVRSDQDVHFPFGRLQKRLLDLGTRAETAHHLNPHGKHLEPLTEGMEVLEY